MGKTVPVRGRLLVALLLGGLFLEAGQLLPLHHHPEDPVAARDRFPVPARRDAALSPDPHESHPIGWEFPDRNCPACPACRNASFLVPGFHPLGTADRTGSGVLIDPGLRYGPLILPARGIRAPPSI